MHDSGAAQSNHTIGASVTPPGSVCCTTATIQACTYHLSMQHVSTSAEDTRTTCGAV
jgi:hypothetical protein